MKLIYVVESSVPYGANKCLIEIIDRLDKDKHEVMVVGADEGALSSWLRERNVSYVSLNHRLSIYPVLNSRKDYLLWLPRLFRRVALNVIAMVKFFKICKRFKPDIVHTNVGPCSLGYFVATYLGIKHVWHVREYQDLDFGMSFFPNRKAFLKRLKRSDAVICITNSIAAHFHLTDNENLAVINDGVISDEKEIDIIQKENYFLFAGRLEAAKGIEEAIESFFEFCETDSSGISFYVAGDGNFNYLKKLKEKVSKSNFSNRVRFLGFRDDIFALMRMAKALVVASRCEGFGLITAEAMYQGTLVIGRDTGGTSEILKDSKGIHYGFLFNSIDELTKLMHEVVDLSPDEYTKMARSAQRRTLDKYTINRNFREISDVYNTLM
ncbi:glycosyltransferase family 4 protein [Shewanella loihica]|nr:glycosyltransferase family 4 protein [Shewanella loihica]